MNLVSIHVIQYPWAARCLAENTLRKLNHRSRTQVRRACNQPLKRVCTWEESDGRRGRRRGRGVKPMNS